MIRSSYGWALAALVVLGGLIASDVALAAENEVVAYRLAKERAMHLDDEKTARHYEASLKKLGCNVRVAGHAGHFDLVYSCPTWRKTAFETHSLAHGWQGWLKSMGFETKHQH